MSETNGKSFILNNLAELERQLAEATRKIERLTAENAKLKTEKQQIKISHEVEKAYLEAGGKRDTSEYDLSSFDLIYNAASRYIKVDDSGKVSIVDPEDGLKLRTARGADYTMRDLMARLKASPVTASLFEAPGVSSSGVDPNWTTREQLRQIRDPAARLARARELGIK